MGPVATARYGVVRGSQMEGLPEPQQRTAGAGLDSWGSLTRRATMRFNLTSEVVDDPHAAERVLWEG
jgi:hypothetical protein